ncbi:hypothetical protein LPJ71_009384, partial [Coemansia sp. S17]
MSAEEVGTGGSARSEDTVALPTGSLPDSTETVSQLPLGSRSSSSQQSILTETSPLPIRTSTARFHSVSARSSPYTVGHLPRTHLGSDAANIPRTAQYHAVGTPARHPLGLQSEAAHSDLATDSLAGEMLGLGSPTSTTTTLSRPLPLSAQSGPGDVYSTGRSDASSTAATAATTERSQSGCLTPLGLDDDDEDDEFSMADPASSTAAETSARLRTNVLSAADTSTSAVVDNDVVKCPICLGTICEAFMTA